MRGVRGSKVAELQKAVEGDQRLWLSRSIKKGVRRADRA